MIAGILFGFVPLVIWLYLLLLHRGFWLLRERDSPGVAEPAVWPPVVAVVPARNEADVIQQSIASLVAHLRLVVRAPIRVIQAWLNSVHGLRLSVGESTDLLRRVAVQGQGAVKEVRERLRASPVVQADETPLARKRAERLRLVRGDACCRAVLRGPPQPSGCRDQHAVGGRLRGRAGQRLLCRL